MVLRGVSFVFILWIGSGATQPNNGFPEDAQQPQLRRQFQADNEHFISQSRQNFPKIQANRRSGESRQDVADPTSRMDLVKSIDDIIRSPYGGPSLDSLSPLLQRHSSFRRPARHSASGLQRDPVPKRRQIPTNDNVPDKIPTSDNDQFLQSNNFQPEFKRQRISQNPSGSVSFSIFESQADNNQKTSVSNWFDHSPEHRSEKKPSYSTDDSFGLDTESRFEKIRQNYNDPFETTSFQRRPNLDGSEDPRIRPNLDRPKSPRRRPINREAYSDTPRRPHDSNRPQRHSNPRPSSRYESYERPRSFPVAEGSSRFEAPFRPSHPAFSRRHTRNRRDLPVDLETQHSGAQRRSSGPTDGRPSGFPAFASIGGTAFLDEGAKVAEGSFSHNFVIPKIKIPDIGDEHPQFGPQSFGTIKDEDYNYQSRPVAYGFSDFSNSQSIPKTLTSDFPKFIKNSPNKNLSPIRASSSQSNQLGTPPINPFPPQKSLFRPIVKDPNVISEEFRPILNPRKNVGSYQPINSVVNSQEPTNKQIIRSTHQEPQSIYVVDSDNPQAKRNIIASSQNNNDKAATAEKSPNEYSDQFSAEVESQKHLENKTIINSLENDQNQFHSQQPIVLPGKLQSSTNILALSPIKIEQTEALTKTLNTFESQHQNQDHFREKTNKVRSIPETDKYVNSVDIGLPLILKSQTESHSVPKFRNDPIPNSFGENEPNPISNFKTVPHLNSHFQADFSPISNFPSEPYSISNFQEEPSPISNFKVESRPTSNFQVEHQQISNNVHNEQSLQNKQAPTSHFAVHDSGSSKHSAPKPQSFKVSIIDKPKHKHIHNDHPSKSNDIEFKDHSKFIEVKPEYPQHPYTASESIDQHGFVNVPRYYEYDSIPEFYTEYETETKLKGVFKPIVDFVKKFIH